MMSVVMLMLSLASLFALGDSLGRLRHRTFPSVLPYQYKSDGLSVILALVRQQGLYPPVEAVPPKPSSLSILKV
jgi:hypothetical protein